MHSSPEWPGPERGRPQGVATGPATAGAGRGLGRRGGAVWRALSPAIQGVRRVPPVSHSGQDNDDDDNDIMCVPGQPRDRSHQHPRAQHCQESGHHQCRHGSH